MRARRFAALALLMLAAAAPAAHARGDAPAKASGAVVAWNGFASNLVAANLPPGPQTHALSVSQIAVHDALNAIHPRYESYAYGAPARAKGASVPAAVAAAERAALSALVPQAAAAVEAEYAAALARIPDGPAEDAGIATGRAAAAAILARRGSDDLAGATTKPYAPGPAVPGAYQLTPPLNFALLAGWGELTPFGIDHASQFRPAKPAAAKSLRYALDYHDVKSLGAADSRTRTAEQTAIARFWYDAAAREWNLAAHEALADRGADEWRAARTLAVLNVALTDAVIATFDAKYHHEYWRPITAIRAGGRDGNPLTRGDSDWEPLCVTPPFPEFPSTHAATAAAAAGTIARELGDRHEFTVTNPSGESRTYRRFSAAAYEKGISRIYCGIHFREAMDVGFHMGAQIARHVDRTSLRALAR